MAWQTRTITNNGWNAGARTVAYLVADGIAEFEVGQAGGIICGLNAVDTDAGYRELDHALWIENNRVNVVEGGIEKTSWVTFTLGATFGIERIAGVVRYYADSTLLYTSLIESTGHVFLDCSLYLAGDSILDARITDYLSVASSLALEPLSAFGTDMTDDYGLVVLSGLTIANEDIPDPIELSPLAALGGDGNFGFIALSPLALVNDELVPDINYGALALSPLQLLVADMSESLEAALELSALDCFGTDADGIGAADLSPITVDGTVLIDNFFIISMPYLTGYSVPVHQAIALGYALRLTRAMRFGYQGHALYRRPVTLGYQGKTHLRQAVTFGYALRLAKGVTLGYAARSTLLASMTFGYAEKSVLRAGLAMGYAAKVNVRTYCALGYAAKSTVASAIRLGYGPRLEFAIPIVMGYRGTFPVAVSRRFGYALGATGFKTTIDLGYGAEPDPDMTPIVPTLTVNGRTILFTSVVLTADEDSPYWQATIELADVDDWRYCPRDAAICLTVGATLFNLLVDRRERRQSMDDAGNRQTTVTLTALSPLCQQTEPRRATLTKTWETPTTAKDIVTELLGAVTWDMPDCPIPAYRFAAEDADPLSLARKLVEAGGGLIESAPDGSVIVRSRWPIAATQLASTTPVALLAETDILAISETSVQDQCLDRERLLDAELATQDQLEFEKSESDPLFGTLTAWLSPWREGVSLLTTRGDPIQLGPTTEVTDTITEIVTFQQGVATAQHPIAQLTGLTWLAESLGGVVVQPYATQLQATSMGSYDGYSLAEITYTTRALTLTARSSLSTDAQFLIWDYSLAE